MTTCAHTYIVTNDVMHTHTAHTISAYTTIMLLGQVSFTCVHTAGFVPLVLTVNVSPPGGHSVRIVASSGGEDTVSYTISDTKTEGENRAIVLLLN